MPGASPSRLGLRLQGGAPLALHAGTALLPRLPWGRGREERGVGVQWPQYLDVGGAPLDGGAVHVRAVPHHVHGAVGRQRRGPAGDQGNGLPRQLGLGGALRRGVRKRRLRRGVPLPGCGARGGVLAVAPPAAHEQLEYEGHGHAPRATDDAKRQRASSKRGPSKLYWTPSMHKVATAIAARRVLRLLTVKRLCGWSYRPDRARRE